MIKYFCDLCGEEITSIDCIIDRSKYIVSVPAKVNGEKTRCLLVGCPNCMTSPPIRVGEP